MTYDLLLNSVSIPVVNSKVSEDVTVISAHPAWSLPFWQLSFCRESFSLFIKCNISSQWAYIQIQLSSTLYWEEIRWRKCMFLCCLKHSGLKQERFCQPQLLTYLTDWDLIQTVSLTTSWVWDFCSLEYFLSWDALDWIFSSFEVLQWVPLWWPGSPGDILSSSSTADFLLCTYTVP